MLMCFKSRFWPAARPLRRLTIMALAQAAILASSLNLSEACLSSQLRESSANRPPPHTLCSWIFPWQGLWITHCMLHYQHGTRIHKKMWDRHICVASCMNIRSNLFRYDQNFQHRETIAYKSFSCSLPCVHKYSSLKTFAWYPSELPVQREVQCSHSLRDEALTNLWAEVVNHSAQTHRQNKLLLMFGFPHLLF